MTRELRIALLAILLLGGIELLAIYVATGPDAPSVDRSTSAPSAPVTARSTPSSAAPPLRPAHPPATAALPRIVSEGRDGIELSTDLRERARELDAIRTQRKQGMMEQLNARAERVATERAKAPHFDAAARP